MTSCSLLAFSVINIYMLYKHKEFLLIAMHVIHDRHIILLARTPTSNDYLLLRQLR